MRHYKRSSILVSLVISSLTVIAGCGSENAPQPATNLLSNENIPPVPTLDSQHVTQGRQLYAQYCAECHGANGEGKPDWKTPNENGVHKAPPHDNSGHTWHHDDELLLDIIANGSPVPGSEMSAFGNKLSDEEILTIIEFMKSWWGSEERAFQWQVTWQARQLK